MKISQKVRSGWEHSFPNLSGKWTHWKLMGDEDYIDVIDGMDLLKALEIVGKNYGKYGSIKAYRASIDENGKIKEAENTFFEISNFLYDERTV